MDWGYFIKLKLCYMECNTTKRGILSDRRNFNTNLHGYIPNQHRFGPKLHGY
jgi:hypothetical protein